MFKGLYLDGTGYARATNPDITGDLTVIVELWKEDWTSSGSKQVAGVFEPSQHSWAVNINGSGQVEFIWSEDGSADQSVTATDISFHSLSSVAIKVELDVDPGTVTVSWAEDRSSSYTELHTENVGVTSLFSSTADLTVGVRNIDSGTPVAWLDHSVIRYVSVNSVVEAIFEDEVRGTTTFTDEQANTWTLSDNAVIVDGQTPELGLWLPDSVEEANEWAVADSPGDLSQANAELIDNYVGDQEFQTASDVVIRNSSGTQLVVDGEASARWREFGDLIIMNLRFKFGSGVSIPSDNPLYIELPVDFDDTFHNAAGARGKGDVVGEAYFYNADTGSLRTPCIPFLRESPNRLSVAPPADMTHSILWTNAPFTVEENDVWDINIMYKKAVA